MWQGKLPLEIPTSHIRVPGVSAPCASNSVPDTTSGMQLGEVLGSLPPEPWLQPGPDSWGEKR